MDVMVFHLIHQKLNFCWHSHCKMSLTINFCGLRLPIQEEVDHLGHILTFNLSDEKDINHRCQERPIYFFALFQNYLHKF